MCISRITTYFILIFISFNNIEFVNGIATPSFYLSFQRSRNQSIDEWAEYKGYMPDLKEFTVCHWDKLTSFNDQISTVWGYCFKTKEMAKKIDCFQVVTSLIPSTVNRHIRIIAEIMNSTW